MIEVAAGILTDTHGRVLLMQRRPGTHLAGTWEFPGGKLEARETIEQALARELREELGIETRALALLISVPWTYPEKTIRLHALRVIGWRGAPHAREGHPLRWSRIEEIDTDTMPPADRPIVAALRLPSFYAITPPTGIAIVEVGAGLKTTGESMLLQLRLPASHRDEIRRTALDLLAAIPALANRLLINRDIELARELRVGVHLRAPQLLELHERPLSRDVWVGVSCHDALELDRAAAIGADFATLSPVRETATHPDALPLGWEGFARLVADARLPVYALGGIGLDDLHSARAAGAQGVAGISGFFPAS